jgi:hypothetical protein
LWAGMMKESVITSSASAWMIGPDALGLWVRLV